uniref:Uncharacterized protein n=1 Tax=Tanacetum cinerariifolium TaxID=118510 RepID=A0A699HDU1_TANCI|nr:hypothetical protein [Tanacetum cinerariifolium]
MSSGPTMSSAYLSRSSSIITTENEPQEAPAPEIQGDASRPSINGNYGENHANAPTFTANGRENISNIPEESTNSAPVDPQDVVGISLVGRRFKDVNPLRTTLKGIDGTYLTSNVLHLYLYCFPASIC